MKMEDASEPLDSTFEEIMVRFFEWPYIGLNCSGLPGNRMLGKPDQWRFLSRKIITWAHSSHGVDFRRVFGDKFEEVLNIWLAQNDG